MKIAHLLLATFALLLAPTLTQAAFEAGWYAGASLGYSHTNAQKEEDWKSKKDLTRTSAPNNSTATNAAQGSLFIGYLFEPVQNTPWRLAPEVFFQYSPNQNEETFDLDVIDTEDTPFYAQFHDKLTYSCTFGCKIRVGYICGEASDLLPYAFIGTAFSPMEWKRYNDGKLNVIQKKTATALLAGIGVEKELKSTHRLGLELGYTHYLATSFQATDSENDIKIYKAQPSIWSLSLRYSIPF